MTDPLRAQLAGHYTLERVLGQGGMATVYLAHDLQHDRHVALKAMLPDYGSAVGADRFRREIRLVAQLQHPHILPVFDSGDAGGQLWFTMPFVDGESLRDRLERDRQLPLPDVARITTQVASALDEAHRRGILHRDVKPENILLTRSGDALLADFGVARPVLRGTGATLTADGIAVGTPAYMSPEQISGDRILNGRSDVYSLGCVVYEALTGEAPHPAVSDPQILVKRLKESPPSARARRPSMSTAWDAVLLQAMAVAPAARFATAGAFAAALAGTDAERGRKSMALDALRAVLGRVGFFSR